MMYAARGARGLEVIPNYSFWKSLPFLIKVSRYYIKLKPGTTRIKFWSSEGWGVAVPKLLIKLIILWLVSIVSNLSFP